jgi:hypothetical protein
MHRQINGRFSAPTIAALLASLIFSGSAAARTWTDTAGVQTEAEIITVVNDVVKLRKADGTVVKVPLSTLSDDDVAFVREYVRDALYRHNAAATESAPSDVGKQAGAVNGVIKKLNDKIVPAASGSADQDALVHSLDEEIRHTTFVFRFPIENVVGGPTFTLSLGPPEGVVGVSGYPATFATTLPPWVATQIATNHILILRGRGRLISAATAEELYATACCVADIYLPETKLYYGIYLENYTWKTEHDAGAGEKAQDSATSPTARSASWPAAKPSQTVSRTPAPSSQPSTPNSAQAPSRRVAPPNSTVLTHNPPRRGPPVGPALKGNFDVFNVGGITSVYVNGVLCGSGEGDGLITIPLVLHAGDCIVIRANSMAFYHSLRFAFVDQEGTPLLVSRPDDIVLRHVDDVHGPVPSEPFDGQMATLGTRDHTRTTWQKAGLPDDAEAIKLPLTSSTFDLAFVVPSVQPTPKQEPVPTIITEPPPASLPEPTPSAPQMAEHRPAPPVMDRHEMDLRLPSATNVREKLTPAMHDQRIARAQQIFGASYAVWKARPNIWVGGFIDSTFWYSMEDWAPEREAKWLWNYQNVIEPSLLSERLENGRVKDEYWKLQTTKPVIDPYYVDPAFADDPDLMYRDEFVEAVYNDGTPVDNWTMPYSWMVAGIVAGIILLIAWAKHGEYI